MLLSLELQALSICPIFSSNMVLQRETEIPVWGWGKPGSEIRVSFKNTIKTSTCKADGSWEIILPPFKAQSSHLQLTISSGNQKIILDSISIGDVWLCAGQSNMNFELYRSSEGEKTINTPALYDIRHVEIKEWGTEKVQTHLTTEPWYKNTTAHLKDFSAVGYYFAEQIAHKQNISIGLINTAWGGSAIESWMSEELFPKTWLKNYRDSIRTLEDGYYEKAIQKLGYVPKGTKPSLDSPYWVEQELPGRWEDKGYELLDGIIYYTKEFFIDPKAELADSLLLSLATIDDADSVWINGQFVGTTNKWDLNRKYRFTKSIVKPGSNHIHIKIKDLRGSGGVRGKAEELYLDGTGDRIELSGSWKFHVSQLKLSSTWEPKYLPTMAYNAMLHPILKFPVKGILWYQGERNAITTKGAQQYGQQLKAMIQDWRAKKAQPELPFLFVQLPGYNDPRSERADDWSTLRQSQLQALELPYAGCAITIDLGEEKDIHPKRKKAVGQRLALIALNQVYGDTSQNFLSPQLQSYQIEGDGLLLHFKNTAVGLYLKDSTIQGFEIKDDQGSWHAAQAEITAPQTLRFRIESVKEIAGVRYAWGNWPLGCSLYNSAGLPAIPFQLNPLP